MQYVLACGEDSDALAPNVVLFERTNPRPRCHRIRQLFCVRNLDVKGLDVKGLQ